MSSSCARREQRGKPAVPLDLSAGEEAAGDGPCTVSCPCGTLGRPIVPRCRYAGEEFARRPAVPASSFGGAHRSAVSVCRRGVARRPTVPASSFGGAHRSAVSVCRRGVRLASGCQSIRQVVPRRTSDESRSKRSLLSLRGKPRFTLWKRNDERMVDKRSSPPRDVSPFSWIFARKRTTGLRRTRKEGHHSSTLSIHLRLPAFAVTPCQRSLAECLFC